jgi:uncharacterized protein DUF6491
MRTMNLILAGLLMGATAATPVLAAAGDACLRHDRIWSSRVFDAHTVVVKDRANKEYTVRVRGACTGLTWGDAVLIFRTWTNLGCVGDGDLLGVRTPAFGFINCMIDTVQAGAPAAGGAG